LKGERKAIVNTLERGIIGPRRDKTATESNRARGELRGTTKEGTGGRKDPWRTKSTQRVFEKHESLWSRKEKNEEGRKSERTQPLRD